MSKSYFLDSSYIVATINQRDQWHTTAKRIEGRLVGVNAQIVTTQFVLCEIANTLSKVGVRQMAAMVLDTVVAESGFTVVECSDKLFQQAYRDFRRHADKDWGLTDCTSFVVMRQLGLTDALTSDKHFVQAGFRALLLDEA